MIAKIHEALGSAPSIPLKDLTLLAPVPELPQNVIAVGRNYRDHAKEFSDSGFDASEMVMVPDNAVTFTKAVSSVIGPGATIDTAGKSPDTFCPIGPCIVTRDEMPALSNVHLRTIVNGEIRQYFPISDMIFEIPTLT